MQKTAATESAINEEQRILIAAIEKYFEKLFASQGKWNIGATG
jgi:hypothetical protein